MQAPGKSAGLRPGFEEWGFAERAWYLEGRQGVTGAIRALLWPTEGVVEVAYHDRVWAQRTPQPPADLFVFRLSDEGYDRLRRHLEHTIADRRSVASFDGSTFYVAARTYHVFHTCHQYAAYALREAGLPLSPGWTFTRAILAMELRRATKMDTRPVDHVPEPRSY
jgi:hypothetical protein